MGNKMKMNTTELVNKCIKQLVIKCRQSKHSSKATSKTVKMEKNIKEITTNTLV